MIQTKDKTIGVRVNKDMEEWLVEMAEEEEISVPAVIRKIIKRVMSVE